MLIIDDSDSYRLLYETLLRSIGVSNIDEAQDGIVGYRKFVMGEFDLVILAYQLPRKSGLDTLREIKGTTMSAKIIVLTAENDKETVLNSIRAGADYYIQKDLPVKELKKKLVEVFNKIL